MLQFQAFFSPTKLKKNPKKTDKTFLEATACLNNQISIHIWHGAWIDSYEMYE